LGRKVHPVGFRLGIIQDWQAKWYAPDPHYAEALQEDMKLRKAIQTKYTDASISRVDIERQAKEVAVTIFTARPGIVIGRGGQRVEEMRQQLERVTGKKIRLNIREIRQPELDAYLVARNIGDQIERRIAYRRAMKQAMFRTMQSGAKGVRIRASGRLGDAEIAREQIMHQGQVPLQTIRADIDYGFAEAHTTLGRIGIKVWIYKGEIFPEAKAPEAEVAAPEAVAVKPEAEAVTAREALAEKPIVAALAEALAAATAPVPAVEAKPAKARKAKKTVAAAEEKPAEVETKPARKARVKAEKPAKATVEEKPVKPARKKATKVEEKPTKAKTETKSKEVSGEKSTPKKRTRTAESKAEVKTTKVAKAKAKPAAEEKPAKPRSRSKKTVKEE